MDTIDCPQREHEHTPVGSHDEDSGEMECEECGFKFIVQIDYDPSYYTSCVEHEYGPSETRASRGELVECRFCIHCQKCELR